MRFGVLRYAHNTLGIIGAICLALGAGCVLVAEKFTTPLTYFGLQEFHKFVAFHQGWFAPLMTVLGGVALWLEGRLGNPKVWDQVDSILNELNESVFSDRRKDFNRVTLFKRCSFSWRVIFQRRIPFGSWLCPVSRSSHVRRWTGTRFRVKDSGEFEGVAGKAWTQRINILIEDLPDLTSASGEDRQVYIDRTHSSERYLNQKGKLYPRSILAIPIETRTDSSWGVLVFDSLDPTLDQALIVRTFGTYAKLLGYLL